MTKYAECVTCGYLIAIPDDANAGDYLCPTDLVPLTASTGIRKRFGVIPDYLEIADDAFITLHGNARTSKIVTFACENWYPTHHPPFGIKALNDPGYISSTLTTAPGATRKMRMYSVGDGIHEKGEQAAGYTAGDTTHNGVMSNITLVTKNAAWVQATPWRLVLDISVGDVTGHYTIYLPSFKMDTYESMRFWITNDGATYYGSAGECDFKHWAAGPSEATEDITLDVAAGNNVVCPVLDTTGFYIGDKARLEDDNNAEWDRIAAIVVNTSITIAHLDYGYTMAANAKIKKTNCVRSPYGTTNMRRGMGRMCCLKSSVANGIAGHYPFPFTQDPNSPLKVALVFCGSIDNPTSETVRMRLQYVPTGPGGNALSDEWGGMKYITVTPGATAGDFVETLFTGGFEVPAIEIHDKKAIQLQLVRMGDDAVNDTYTGCFLLVAVLVGITEKHFGPDMRMD